MIPELSTVDILRLVTMAASAIAAFRIVMYRCQGRYKFGVSLIAWALAFFMSAQAISIAFMPSAAPGFYQAGIAIILMIGLCRSKGNVSHLLRGD